MRPRTCGPDSTLVEVPGLAMKDLTAQAERFDAGVLAQDITILEELRRNMRQNQTGRALLDATLVRLAMAEQFLSINELLSHPDGPTPLGLILPRVVDLRARRAEADAEVPAEVAVDLPAALRGDDRPLPSVAPYDDLLKGAGS